MARAGLRLASLPYSAAVRCRNIAYDRGWKKTHRVSVPVVSVGNLTVGGTGKTPIVEMIARWYRDRGVRIAILSRGYGATDGMNDEAMLLEENLPDVPHLQGVDRAELARIAVEELESELLLLDDGMQHRRLARDLEIVLVDAMDPFGGGYLLPGGLLREPLSGLRRASAIVLTRCDSIDDSARDALHATLERCAPTVPIVNATIGPRDLLRQGASPSDVDLLRGKRVLAFSGIGNPKAFERTLADLGTTVLQWRIFPDHYAYARADVQSLSDWAQRLKPDAFVTTQKDVVKLRLADLGGVPLWAVRVSANMTAGWDRLESLLSAFPGAGDLSKR